MGEDILTPEEQAERAMALEFMRDEGAGYFDELDAEEMAAFADSLCGFAREFCARFPEKAPPLDATLKQMRLTGSDATVMSLCVLAGERPEKAPEIIRDVVKIVLDNAPPPAPGLSLSPEERDEILFNAGIGPNDEGLMDIGREVIKDTLALLAARGQKGTGG